MSQEVNHGFGGRDREKHDIKFHFLHVMCHVSKNHDTPTWRSGKKSSLKMKMQGMMVVQVRGIDYITKGLAFEKNLGQKTGDQHFRDWLKKRRTINEGTRELGIKELYQRS